MSHNPHPPDHAPPPLRAWPALQDALNHRFGWADPLDPAGRRILVPPDLLSKRAAEMRRAGREPDSDPRLRFVAALEARIRDGEIRSGTNALKVLETEVTNAGM